MGFVQVENSLFNNSPSIFSKAVYHISFEIAQRALSRKNDLSSWKLLFRSNFLKKNQ